MFTAQHARIFSSLKNATLIPIQRTLQVYKDNNARLLLPVSTMHASEYKSIHMTSVHNASIINSIQPMRPFEKVLSKIGLVDIQKYKNIGLAYLAYEHVLKQIDYPFFFKHFNLADTFFSWFLITELHVWMIMVRYMAEGNNGKTIRNNVVAALWEDTNAKVDTLGISSKIKNKQLKELSEQFNAAIIGYDEGIQSEDKVLAGALWRRFFHLECNNPEHIETLLIYVRKQIYLFDNLPSHEILRTPTFKLIDLKSLCKHHVY